MNRASLRNEGKIHLGLTYAMDDSLATPDLMLDGALSFRRILRDLLGARMDKFAVSTPYAYLVAKDTLLTPDDLEKRYAEIDRIYVDKIGERPDNDYLGHRPLSLIERDDLNKFSPHISSGGFLAAFRSEELAVNPEEIARHVVAAVSATPQIEFLANHRVETVERHRGQLRVSGTSPEGDWHVDAEQVINALWDSRIEVDRSMGVDVDPGWVHRLKYRVIARVPERLRNGPSATIVVGRYGDVVMWPNGTACFSWYPLGLQGWSDDVSPPASWEGACKGEIEADLAETIARGTLAAIDSWYPGAAESEPVSVDAGVIVAYGKSDVDDPKSGLHQRTRVGVNSFDDYHSLDPGKLTTAPFFGLQAAQRVLSQEKAN